MILAFVYFVLGINTNMVKIGFTSDLDERLKVFRSQSPDELKLICLIPHRSPKNAYADERRFHTLFQNSSSHNEWFRYDHEIRTYLHEVLRCLGCPFCYMQSFAPVCFGGETRCVMPSGSSFRLQETISKM